MNKMKKAILNNRLKMKFLNNNYIKLKINLNLNNNYIKTNLKLKINNSSKVIFNIINNL